VQRHRTSASVVTGELSPNEMSGTRLVSYLQQTAGNRAVTTAVQHAPAAGLSRLPVQRWWAGTRQLSGLGWLGKPWDLGGNPSDLGVYHKHIWMEDGESPGDIGHMGPKGLGQDSEHDASEYTATDKGDDDATMRVAIEAHSPAPKYKLLSDNCQKWVRKVISTYHRMGGWSERL